MNFYDMNYIVNIYPSIIGNKLYFRNKEKNNIEYIFL